MLTTRCRLRSRTARQCGITLIETLTALLVFSVGIIGAVSLQAHALRHVDEANNRLTAAHLAASLLARMWIENPATLAERYDSRGSGQGYSAFVLLVQALPGTKLAANAPTIAMDNGRQPSTYTVAVSIHWQ